MSSAQRHHTMPTEQHPSESLPDEVIPNDAPCLPSSTARQPGAIYDARARGGAPIDRLPWPPAASISYPGPVEQSPAESLPDEAIPNDAPRFPGSSTERGNVSNGLSTWPSSTQTSSPDVSAASAGWSETGRPRLAPLTTGHSHGHDPSEGELMRSPSSAAPTEIPPPPYERGLSSPAPGAIVRDPASAGSNEFSPPQHAYPGLPPGVSPVSAGGASGQGSQDALIHGALHDASSRGVSGGEPGEAVALPKYSHRPQDGNARLEEQPDGSYKMFPAGQNGLVAMNAIGGSETTSDPEATAGTERTLVQSERGAVVVEEETPTKNPLRKVWRRHFKGPQNRTRRKWLITAIVFVVVFLIILLAVLGAKKKLAGQDDDDSDSDDDDDDDDDDE